MQALIKITGTQTIDDQNDTVELTTSGTYLPTEDGWQLCYDESAATGMEGTTTTVHVKGDRIVMERSGENASILVIEKHRRHHSHYITPYGTLDLGTYATAVERMLDEDGGTLELRYTFDLNGSVRSTQAVRITVRQQP